MSVLSVNHFYQNYKYFSIPETPKTLSQAQLEDTMQKQYIHLTGEAYLSIILL